MIEAWLFFYMIFTIPALIGILLMFVVWDIQQYVKYGWKKYPLTENEYRQLLVQTLEKSWERS